MLIRAKIVLGTKDKTGRSPIYPGAVAEVDDKVGKRYVESGLAVEIDGTAPKSTDTAAPVSLPCENPSRAENAQKAPESLENEHDILQDMTYTELKALAKEKGIEIGRIKSKAGMIEAITAFDETPPVFDAQEVIE